MIRPATTADHEDVLRLAAHCLRFGPAPAWVVEWWESPRVNVYVAEVDGQVVGFTLVAEVEDSTLFDMWDGRLIAVDPVFRGRGIGRALLVAVQQAAVSLHRRGVLTGVAQDNTPMLDLVRSLGFKHHPTDGLRYPDGTSALLMIWYVPAR